MINEHSTEHQQIKTSRQKQAGFTLVELLITLTIIAMLTQVKVTIDTNTQIEQQAQTQADRTIQEVKNIQSAASGYIVDQNKWPDFSNGCTGAINTLKNAPTAYLNHITPISPYNTTYITECNTNTFTVKIKSEKDFAAPYIASMHPGSAVLAAPDDDTTSSSVPRPEEQPALQSFLMLDGSRAMTGDLDVGGNDIKNALNIELNGKDIKLGIGKFVSMGSDSFSSLSAIVTKPNCAQGGGVVGTPKVILRIHGVTTTLGSPLGIRNVSWSATFNSISSTRWRLSTTGLSSITGVAETFCDYGSWNR